MKLLILALLSLSACSSSSFGRFSQGFSESYNASQSSTISRQPTNCTTLYNSGLATTNCY